MAGGRVPVSQLLLCKSIDDEEPKKKSREEWRKAKELDEARKAGTAPAAVDEAGKDINPHIPQYISSVPWYYNNSGPTLKHQRSQEDNHKHLSKTDERNKKGISSVTATKYRKGACENCGAMTHKKKECLERPRKFCAKYSNVNIAPDESIHPELVLDFDGKRDRWSGYDPSMHKDIVDEFQKIEEAKRQLKTEKLKEDPNATDDEEDEDKYADDFDMPGTKVDSKQRITVRNLRIREDTAKYLMNLDPNSAFYDPKTRSMRDNPTPKLDPENSSFAGENFVRFTGDTQQHAKAQLFAWEAYGKGVDVHVLAEPTKLELLQTEYEKARNEIKSDVKSSVLDKYGGEEYLKVPEKALLLAQTEKYIEYSRYGKVVKGPGKNVARSNYEEDIYINNHTSIFGSNWNNGKWGYKCCNSFLKNSYCVSSNVINEVLSTSKNSKVDSRKINSVTELSSYHSRNIDSEDNIFPDKKRPENDKDKFNSKYAKLAIIEENNKRKAELMIDMDQIVLPYNRKYDRNAPTEEEIDAYNIKRRRDEDPMSKILNKKKR